MITFYRIAKCRRCNREEYSINIGRSVGHSPGSYCNCGMPWDFTDSHKPFPGQEDIAIGFGYYQDEQGNWNDKKK